ncbi:hypothetical protein D3C86_2013910 [compost metagenome]
MAVMLGVAHLHIDHKRDGDHDRHIPEKPLFMADLLELQRHEFSRAAEDRVGERVRQSDAERTDMRREKLGLHHSVDRRVAGHDQQADQR